MEMRSVWSVMGPHPTPGPGAAAPAGAALKKTASRRLSLVELQRQAQQAHVHQRGARGRVAVHDNAFALVARQVGDGDGAFALQVLGQRLFATEVGRQKGQVFDDQASRVDAVGLHVLTVHTSVADVRVR